LLSVDFVAVEVVVGFIAGSLALISDAAQMLTDAAAIGLALVAMRLAARPANGALLHIVANEITVSAQHQPVAPVLFRSRALFLLLEGVRQGDLAEDLALHRNERITETKAHRSKTAR